MLIQRLALLRQAALAVFPERHLYLRSGGEMRSIRLSSGRQITAAAVAAAVVGWCLLSTGALLLNGLTGSASARDAAFTVARYERQVADREARLQSASARLNGGDEVTQVIESRHMALASLLGDMRNVPGAADALAPQTINVSGMTAEQRLQQVRADQDRLLNAAESFARTRGERLQLAFRMAGLDASAFAPTGSGGPLVQGDEALAAVLDVDTDFARRVQRASMSLSEMRRLDAAAGAAPFATPVADIDRSSSFGGRSDPLSGGAAFHSGVDFRGAHRTPIRTTAPGVVAFVGTRNGYGNVVEVDHGRGIKTRYAHLADFSVRPGQRVSLGDQIGLMGSTGRSTGTHLHYEVWVDGRVQNPDRFLGAGQIVRESRQG